MKAEFKNINYTKRVAVLFSVIIAIMLVFAAGFAGAHKSVAVPHADDTKTLTIHVYDTAQEYQYLAGWIWIKGEDGKEYPISSAPAANEGFLKEYELNGSTVTNKAYTLTATFTAAEIARASAIGFLVCRSTGNTSGEFWSRYSKEGIADVFVSPSLFDGTNSVDIYYIRKDSVTYTDLEEAKMALEKVLSARFTSTSKVEFEVTSPVTSSTTVTLLEGGVEKSTANASPDLSNAFKGSATFSGFTFDYAADYTIKVGLIPTPAPVSKSALIDELGFIQAYETAEVQSLQYGAIYTKQKTTFRLWAPFANKVSVRFYRNGSDGNMINAIAMTKRTDAGTGKWAGVWELEREGDYKNYYYTYYINNSGVEVETIDPYAKACGINGNRGMIIDMDSADPDGWESDNFLYKLNSTNANLPIIWELHVRDFSSSADSGMVNKGKYLAFTETGTTVPGRSTVKTGVDYLQDLGITYVHLNPVYDFGSIDESITTDINNKDKFNWGYDPQNYNIPEGSYSSDPTDGNVRVNEFKQMVMALHKAGIGVIMDVVYNHTYSTSNLALGDAVPGYFYRTDAFGNFSDGSGCGNEIASERSMVRKYMVDSVKYWAEEYHIDGFRFDLMGVHDKITMQKIREALDGIEPGQSSKLLMYGEPWTGGDLGRYSYGNRIAVTGGAVSGTGPYTSNAGNELVTDLYSSRVGDLGNNRIAVFDGQGRDAVRGGSWDIAARQDGWIQTSSEERASTVRGMICGSNNGVSAPSQTVAYASVHDNFTLYDHLIGKDSGKETMLSYNVPIDYYMNMQSTVSATYLMSRGMPLMIAGEEMSRTKYGNHNSYNSPIKLNQIEWSRQISFSKVYNHYKKLIAVRKAYSDIFSYTTSQNTSAVNISVNGTGVITQSFSANGKTLYATYNSTAGATSVTIPNGCKVYVLNGTVSPSNIGSSVTVNSKCCVVYGTVSV